MFFQPNLKKINIGIWPGLQKCPILPVQTKIICLNILLDTKTKRSLKMASISPIFPTTTLSFSSKSKKRLDTELTTKNAKIISTTKNVTNSSWFQRFVFTAHSYSFYLYKLKSLKALKLQTTDRPAQKVT